MRRSISSLGISIAAVPARLLIPKLLQVSHFYGTFCLFLSLEPGLASSELLLHRSLSDRASKVVTTLTMLKEHLFRYQGHIGAALILGGVDTSGPHLFSVYPHGSSDSLPYAAMGSGSLAAISVLENGYHDGMSEDEAKKLIVRAIRSGIFNDLGSGSEC